MKRGLYQGWTGWRNLGDQAMFQACRQSLSHVRWRSLPLRDSPPAVLTFARARDFWLRAVHTCFWGQAAILGGGTLINRTPVWLDQYRLLRRAIKKPVPVFSPGVADPRYWSGKKGWRDTRAEWREELADLPVVGVRGPHSKRLLEEAGFRNVLVTGDPALAFHRAHPPPASTRRVVAINAGRSHGEMWGDENRVIAAIADAARRFTALGFEVRIFPVWDRDEPVCHEVARAAGLSADCVDPLIQDAAAFVRYLDRFAVVVSLKLHAAVLAAAAAVPFVAVEYRPKVRDFTDSVGWDRFTFRSDQVQERDLERSVQQIYDDRDRLRAHLDARVSELLESFRAYTLRVQELLLT